jgi:hypothetical protein
VTVHFRLILFQDVTGEPNMSRDVSIIIWTNAIFDDTFEMWMDCSIPHGFPRPIVGTKGILIARQKGRASTCGFRLAVECFRSDINIVRPDYRSMLRFC